MVRKVNIQSCTPPILNILRVENTYVCGIITTYQQILIMLDDLEIIFIGALFHPGTAVVTSRPREPFLFKLDGDAPLV